MRLTTNAACMASPAPNPYGQAPASGAHIQYTDHNQQQQQHQHQHLQQQQQPSSTKEPNPLAYEAQQRMNLISGDKPFIYHSGSPFANYDPTYISGMSSDSELTTSSTGARHYHHRPYSSQSRVYHAHPVPRNSPDSSRLSHYSSNSAANVHSVSSSFAIQQQQQQQQQLAQHHQQQKFPPHNQSLSTTPPSKPISSISHQSSVASSGGSLSSGSYLPPMMPQDSPVSPVLMRQQQQQQQQQQQTMRQKTGGRQLPQRPFTQSMSIDQHSRLGNQYQPTTGQMPIHSPAHEPRAPGLGLHRNLTGDQLGAYQQKSYPGAGQVFEPAIHYNETLNQRNMRLEMDRVEMQAAAMNLYDSGDSGALANLPPTGPARSTSSSSGRHLPNIMSTSSGLQQQQQQQQQQHQIDPFNQTPQDLYTSHHHHQQQQQQQHKIPLASTSDWMPMSNQTARSGSQFKQTMSIDHYPASKQQQRHYSAAVKQGQYGSTEQYHSLGPYVGTSTSTTNQPSGMSTSYDPNQMVGHTQSISSGLHQDQNMKYHHYSPPQQQQQQQLHHHQQQQQQQQQHQFNSNLADMHAAKTTEASAHSSVQHHLPNRPKLQHQPSSSSSNSNLSGSLKTSNIENSTNLEKQPLTSGEHQKSLPSASTSTSNQYHQSPQHKLPPAAGGSGHYGGRQELLRRGNTSVTASSGGYGGDFGGSQSALSESGDLSMMQTSHSSHTGRRLRAASPSAALEGCSSSGPQHSGYHPHHHSTSSGHGIRESVGMRSESTTGLPNGSGGSSTLTKKSNSATQLSMTGTKKRLGFRKKQVTSFSVHRSEEVAPLEARHLVKQGSSVSEGDSSMSGDSSSRSWSNSKQTPEELASMSFIDGLGKGQMISRQGLASPYLGDIQLSLCDRRGNLEIEVIRARNLQSKTNKIFPMTYVKLYLVKNRKCLAKAKTTLSNKRSLSPMYQQQLTFHEDYRGCILQSIVWGNFGKMDKKNFMGIAQISIDDLELSDTVISWYKLFLPSSLQTLPSKSLRHTLLSNSTESFTNTNNS